MPKPSDLPLKAKLFRGLADRSRLAVLETLRGGPRCVSEIVADTDLSQPNASAHLACLLECGLVTRERRAQFVYYEIADKRVVKVLEEAEAILSEVAGEIFRCTRYEDSRARKPRAGTRRRPRSRPRI